MRWHTTLLLLAQCLPQLALLMSLLCIPGGGHLLEFGPSYDRVADYAMRIVRHVDLLCFS